MRIWLVLLLMACQGYQPEPYAEVRVRDETFGEIDYEGGQLLGGIRYVYKPQRREPLPARGPAIAAIPEGRTFEGELAAVSGWPWYAWFGLPFVILAAAVLLWVWRRKVKKANGK